VVAVPSAWNLYTEALWGYEGVGWFLTDLPAQAAQTRLSAEALFRPVAWHAKAWLNGHLLGEHLGAIFRLSSMLRGGLILTGPTAWLSRVDNAPRLEWLPGSLVIERVTIRRHHQPGIPGNPSRHLLSTCSLTATPDGTGALVCCRACIRTRYTRFKRAPSK